MADENQLSLLGEADALAERISRLEKHCIEMQAAMDALERWKETASWSVVKNVSN